MALLKNRKRTIPKRDKMSRTELKKAFDDIQKLSITAMSDNKSEWIVKSLSKEEKYKDYFNLVNETHPEHSYISEVPKEEFNTQSKNPKIRVLKKEVIEDKRKKKNKINNISLRTFLFTGENGYYSMPDEFKFYVRNSNEYISEISKLEEIKNVFKNNQMVETSESLASRVSCFDVTRDSFLGFRRLSPVHAAIISAKVNGIKWHDNNLYIPKKGFAASKYGVQEEIGDRYSYESNSYMYQARIYPLWMISNDMPKLANEVLAKLDNFYGHGCPLFDYYWAVVPSINVKHRSFMKKSKWTIKDGDEIHEFADEESAANKIDFLFIRDGVFCPVILGERDGKCYFVCMWH